MVPRKTFSDATMADAIAVLSDDHHKLLQLFAQFRQMPHDGSDARQTLIEIVCTELVIHTQVEEELLYPALRRTAFGDPAAVEEARVEHLVARQLIGDLEMMEPDDDLYDARFKVLGEYVRHHIEEEESRIFPLLLANRGEAGGEPPEAANLAAALLARREELRSEFGMPNDGYGDTIDDGSSPQPAARSASPGHPRP